MWKFALMEIGALCVMMAGVLLMLVLYADSWDSAPLVRKHQSLAKLYTVIHNLSLQVLRQEPGPSLAKAVVIFNWTMWPVPDLSPDSLTVQLIQLAYTTVSMLKMLEWFANRL